MENQDKKKLLENKMTVIITILCIIGMITIIGYTYSFFAAEVSNAVTIKGDAASPTVNLTISRVAPTEDKKLIPQLDAVIHKAVIGTQGNCLDDNHNAVCQVYKITVTNTSTAATYINGKIELDAKDNPHLKWAEVSGLSNTTLVSDVKLHSETILTSNELYEGGEAKDYYVVVWISETGVPQTDSGSFNGTVTIENVASSNPAFVSLANLGLMPETEQLTTFTSVSSAEDTGVYASEDDLGTSYYFRGAVTNNYVNFAGYYWRIIRINGDGSIRLIYDGTTAHENGISSSDRYIGRSSFNTNSDDNAYVGYMYGTAGSTTYEDTHENINDSAIKIYLEEWYETEIKNKGYSNYVVDAIYCNDRTRVTDATKISQLQILMQSIGSATMSSEITGEGYGTFGTFYSLLDRVDIDKVGYTPSLKCAQENDRFTLRATYGNGKLNYPIGLITADEVVFAGGFISTESPSYLNNGNDDSENEYWTITPAIFDNKSYTFSYDSLIEYSESRYGKRAVRPVISIKSDSIEYGNGTVNNPFRITENIELITDDDFAISTLTNLGLSISEGTPDFSKSSCSSGCGEATVGIYKTVDDFGVSYYFRGDVENNYVKFGKNSSGSDMYWRIIRINGDGSIRMIYDGTQAYANGISSTDRQIGTSAFNTYYDDNAYVGYMYGTVGSTTYEATHSNINDSTIKIYIDNWYETNIINTGYSGYVVDSIYCNDRRVMMGSGAGTNDTYYRSDYISSEPTLKCSKKNDRFTKNTKINGVDGNGKLRYPVGLLTKDEAFFCWRTKCIKSILLFIYRKLLLYDVCTCLHQRNVRRELRLF